MGPGQREPQVVSRACDVLCIVPMSHEIISTDGAPAAIGPYSQAVAAGGFVFLSGQIGLVPETMQIISDDVADQTRRAMQGAAAVLAAAGCSFDNVVKTTIFLADMNDFKAVNDVYGSFFTAAPPARETVAVRTLPMNVKVEISMIAFKG